MAKTGLWDWGRLKVLINKVRSSYGPLAYFSHIFMSGKNVVVPNPQNQFLAQDFFCYSKTTLFQYFPNISFEKIQPIFNTDFENQNLGDN